MPLNLWTACEGRFLEPGLHLHEQQFVSQLLEKDNALPLKYLQDQAPMMRVLRYVAPEPLGW